jgi:hypothetical protein
MVTFHLLSPAEALFAVRRAGNPTDLPWPQKRELFGRSAAGPATMIQIGYRF